MTTIAILRQLSAAHAASAAAFRQAADELEAAGVGAESAKAVAVEEAPKKRGPKAKAAVAEEVVEADPLAGLSAAAPVEEVAEPEPEVVAAAEEDPLAGLMGEPEVPAEPAITREALAKTLGEFAAAVDSVKGKGSGSQALASLFKKHGSENLKTLAEAEFLEVKNEAVAIMTAIKNMKK